MITRTVTSMIRYWNSHRYEVSFLGIPKCGVTTVCQMIGADMNKDWTQRPLFNTSFTVVRDPVDRFYSMYHHLRRARISKAEDIVQFMDEIRNKGFYNVHVQPIAYFWRPVDRVFRVDKIRELSEWLGIEHRDYCLNASPDYKQDHRFLVQTFINKVYPIDMEIWKQA